MLLSGISTEAAKSIDASLHVSVIDNWYFMATSVIVLTLVGGLITDKLVEPRLGQWQGSRDEKLQTLTPGSGGLPRRRGDAGIRGGHRPDGGPRKRYSSRSGSAYGHALAVYQRHRAANYLFFFVVSLAYGIATGKIRRQPTCRS